MKEEIRKQIEEIEKQIKNIEQNELSKGITPQLYTKIYDLGKQKQELEKRLNEEIKENYTQKK